MSVKIILWGPDDSYLGLRVLAILLWSASQKDKNTDFLFFLNISSQFLNGNWLNIVESVAIDLNGEILFLSWPCG